MSTAARAADRDRPRLWVPGLLYVTDQGEISLGRQVGYGGEGRAFRHGRCGRWDLIEDWSHTAWLVERSALTDSVVSEHALILPETLVDPDHQPHAQQWLREQPLVCVSGLKETRLGKAGLRVWRVSFDATRERVLGLRASGGSGRRIELRAPLDALRASGQDGDEPTRPALDRDRDPSLVDRVLRQLSGGTLTERSVVQALQARSLVEDGYGYHGKEAGDFRSVDAIERDAQVLEALFAAVYDRAAEQREPAAALRAALPRAAVEEDAIEVPLYGTARRVLTPTLRYALNEASCAIELALDDEPQVELVLDAETRWFVDDVSPWSPTLPAELEQRLDASASRSSSTARLLGLLALIAALVVLVLVGWAAR